MIRNERGLTLIELLAITVILSIVIGIVFFLMNTFFQTWDDANTSSESQMEISQTLHHVSAELSEAAVVYHPHASELRFESIAGVNEYKALVYEDGSLILYHFSGSEHDFTDSAITQQTRPSLYTMPHILNSQLAGAPVYRRQSGEPFTIMENGGFFTIDFTFLRPVGPAQQTHEDVHQLGITLFKE